mmetsp:Transcript_24860/g.66402  ORF Transcript_24860/g.66402 Transcript_24860/m.66402 type:complete len:289 (-) Transcript_24860:524-1390(-)
MCVKVSWPWGSWSHCTAKSPPALVGSFMTVPGYQEPSNSASTREPSANPPQSTGPSAGPVCGKLPSSGAPPPLRGTSSGAAASGAAPAPSRGSVTSLSRPAGPADHAAASVLSSAAAAGPPQQPKRSPPPRPRGPPQSWPPSDVTALAFRTSSSGSCSGSCTVCWGGSGHARCFAKAVDPLVGGTACMDVTALGSSLTFVVRLSSERPNLRQKASYCCSTSSSVARKKPNGITEITGASLQTAPSSTAARVRLSSACFSMQNIRNVASLLPGSASTFCLHSRSTTTLV